MTSVQIFAEYNTYIRSNEHCPFDYKSLCVCIKKWKIKYVISCCLAKWTVPRVGDIHSSVHERTDIRSNRRAKLCSFKHGLYLKVCKGGRQKNGFLGSTPFNLKRSTFFQTKCRNTFPETPFLLNPLFRIVTHVQVLKRGGGRALKNRVFLLTTSLTWLNLFDFVN